MSGQGVAWKRLETVDFIHLFALATVSLVVVLRRGAIDRAAGLLVLDLGLMLLVAGAALGPCAGAPRSRAAVWRLVISFGLVVVLFSQLAVLVPAVNAQRYDQVFLEIDSRYLGFVPFRSLGFMVHPFVSELLSIVYLTFYAIPIAFFVVLYRGRMLEQIAAANAAVVTGFYISFLGNAIFPAVSPFRVLTPDEPLSGLLLFDTFYGLVEHAEPHVLSAFPSGHILVSTIVVLLCARWRLRALPWFIAWVLLLWSATLYLGYHYLVDTIAALPLAPLSIGVAQALRRRWYRQAL